MTHRALALSCWSILLTASMLACGGSGSETPPPVEPTTPTRPESEAVRRAEPEAEPAQTSPSEEQAVPDPGSESLD